MLHVPDYFHYLLTGKKTCEYTEATTGQLVNAETKDWDYELIDKLGYPRKNVPEADHAWYQCWTLYRRGKSRSWV